MQEEKITVEVVLEGDKEADESVGVGHSASSEEVTIVTDK